MYTSGFGIGRKGSIRVLQSVIPQVLPQARTGGPVVVVGSEMRVTPASPTGTGSTRPTAAATRVFVLPGLSYRIVLPGPLNRLNP